MPDPNRQDSNIVGLRWAEYPGLATWHLLDPNSFGPWGRQLETVARRPLAVDRQSKKGNVVGQTVRGSFISDFTHNNVADLFPCFMYARFRRQAEFGGAGEITAIDAGNSQFQAASGLGVFAAGDLVFASNNSPSLGNNGLHLVSAATATAVTVGSTLNDETPPAASKLVRVGHQFGAGAVEVNVTGPYPVITVSGVDLTTYNLTPGMPIFIGGDTSITRLTNAANNGPKRLRRVISATQMELDKSTLPMMAETGGSQTVQIFFPRVLKNEATAALIEQIPIELERTLGPGDTASPGNLQSEYLIGAVGDTLMLDIPAKNLMTCDMTFKAAEYESRDSTTGVKAGARPGIRDKVPYNTSTDVTVLSMTQVVEGNEAPPQLFTYLQNLRVRLNNNTQENNAVGVFGSFELTAGDFEVGLEASAYFSKEDIIATISGNIDVTAWVFMTRNNQGFSIDYPLVTLRTDGLQVERNRAVMLPLEVDAHSGEQIDELLDYTVLFAWFDYLPTFAKAPLNTL